MSEPRIFDRETLTRRLERGFEFAAGQVRSTIERDPDFFPIYTRNGRWRHDGPGWTDWCAGFHAGMMWLLAERTGEREWRQHAEHYSRLLEHKQHDRNVHDLGFIFLNTYLPWFRLTGDRRLREVLITAGRTLALRFEKTGGYLRSFVAPESLFIDIMMNVPLIFFAARESGDPAISITWPACTAIRPSAPWSVQMGRRRTRAFLTRTPALFCDSRPIKDFAPIQPGRAAWHGRFMASAPCSHTQEAILISPSQYATQTAISRGLRKVWSLPGISTCSTVPTGSKILRLPRSLPRDSGTSPPWSNLAIQSERSVIADATLTILDSLSDDYYLASTTPGWEGVLKHAVYHFHKKLGVDESVMWGDFFFLEAMHKVLGPSS